MNWFPSCVAAFPVLVMAYIALSPIRSHRPAAQWLLALIAASLGSLLLASHASSLLGLLPCAWQSYTPPCTRIETGPNLGAALAGLGLGFWAFSLGVLALDLRASKEHP